MMQNPLAQSRLCLVALAAGMTLGLPAVTAAQQGAAPVAVSTVVQREVSAGQTFVGTVKPLKLSEIGSAVDGRVIEYPVNEGDRVSKGQTLAQLRTGNLEIQLAGAKAELRLREEELRELKNGSRPEEIAQAQARMEKAQATREYARSKYQRTRQAHEQGSAASQEQLDQALAAMLEAEQTYLESKAAHELVVEGPRKEKIAQAEARAAAQREEVNRIQDQIDKHTIKVPFDGYVVTEHTEEGEWVNSGELVAEVVALDQVDVEAFVLEDHIPYVRRGMDVRVEVSALPDEVLTGKVARVVPQGRQKTRTFPVKVRVENRITDDGPLIKSGMMARVTLPTGPTKQGVLVPKDAIVLGGPQPVIYVVDAPDLRNAVQRDGTFQPVDGQARRVPVELGVADGNLIQVEAALEPGQAVVVRGNERIQIKPGQKAAPVKVANVLAPDAEPQAEVGGLENR